MSVNDFFKRVIGFGLIILTLFFIYDIYTGKLFESDANGKMTIVGVSIAWLIDCIGKIKTILLISITCIRIIFFITRKNTRSEA